MLIKNRHENEISNLIIASSIEVHRVLGGPGLLETVYEEALVWQSQDNGLLVERQVAVPLHYKGRPLSTPLRLDLLFEKKVIVEVKAVIDYNPIFNAQARTYLRLTNLKLALVINFGEKLLNDGIHRIVNGL